MLEEGSTDPVSHGFGENPERRQFRFLLLNFQCA